MPGVLRWHKSGRVECFDGTETAPPSPSNGVASKDVALDPAANISARLYLPPAAAAAEPGKKLPVVLFFHGGAFFVHTAASPLYHRYAATLAAAVPAVAVSVDYRLAPEHPISAAYDDAIPVSIPPATGFSDRDLREAEVALELASLSAAALPDEPSPPRSGAGEVNPLPAKTPPSRGLRLGLD